MKRNKMIKICAVTALASCLTAGLGVVAASASTGEPTDSSKIMTFGGAATKIVSDLKDSGLAFKYELDKSVFANTAAGEVAFATGASAGIIVSVEGLPADFDARDESTYGGAKKFAIGAEYWGLNEGETKMQGFAYLYNIPNVEYDTEVTAIGYVTTSEGTTYTAAEKRSMAYVAHEAIKDESDKAPTAEQKLLLDGFLPNYTVSFTVDGVAYEEAQTVKYGEKATAPAEAPEKAGYAFDKWVIGEGDFDANAAITANVEVVAAFTQNLVYVPSVDVAKAAGAEVVLKGTTNDLGVVYSDEATRVAYAVTKTVGGSTASASAVILTDNKFTVEAGCLYDVEITINDTQKAYVQVRDGSVIVIGNTAKDTFIVHGVTTERVDTDGDLSFKVFNSTGKNQSNVVIQMDGALLDDTVTKYDVYATLKHSYNVYEGGGNFFLWLKSEDGGEGTAIQADGRFKIGTTSGVTAGYHEFKFHAVMNRNVDCNVIFDNIVLIPATE